MVSYRDAAVALWGEAGGYVHDAYSRFHHLYPELPDQVPIVIGLTAYGRCMGSTRVHWDYGPRITISSTIFGQGTRVVDDVVVHEMLHAWLGATGQEVLHDSEAWYAAVRRLSPAVLGRELDVVRCAGRRSVRVPNPAYGQPGQPKTLVRKVRTDAADQHLEMVHWPVRPPGTSPGKPLRCPTSEA